MDKFNIYLEFINSLDNAFEEINSIVSILLHNDTKNSIDVQSILFYLSLLDRLLTCFNRDLEKIYYLINK